MTAPFRPRVLFAGGGTAGHVMPMLAVASELAERGWLPSQMHLLGSRRGQEGPMAISAGLQATLLPGRGLRRHPRQMADWLENTRSILGLAWGVVGAMRLVGRFDPDVVLVVGGYASVPGALAAWLRHRPLIVVNLDAVPGAANRWAARHARIIASGFDGTPWPSALRDRVVVTGAPLRKEIVAMAGSPRDEPSRERAKAALGMPQGVPLVVVVGGSLGAGRLNEAAFALKEESCSARASSHPSMAMYHIVGRRNWPDERAFELDGPPLFYRAVPYEDRMPLCYQAADIVVARSGALTVAELAAMGVPAILVPLPGAPGDHQARNASELVRAGIAVVIPDALLDGVSLRNELERLLGGAGGDGYRQLDRVRASAVSLARPDAAALVADIVEKLAVDREARP